MMKFNIINAVSDFAKKHEGTILTCCTVGSTLAAVYLTFKATPKLMDKLDELKDTDMTNFEKAKEIAPIIAGPAIATAGAVGFAICNNVRTADKVKNAFNMMSLYKTVDDTRKKYTEEIVGEEKAKEIEQKVIHDIPDAAFIHTGYGEELFYDELTNSWFYSNVHAVNKAITELNKELMYEAVGVEDYVTALGINCPSALKNNYWNIERDADDRIEVEFEPAKLYDERLYRIIKLVGPDPKYDAWRSDND